MKLLLTFLSFSFLICSCSKKNDSYISYLNDYHISHEDYKYIVILDFLGTCPSCNRHFSQIMDRDDTFIIICPNNYFYEQESMAENIYVDELCKMKEYGINNSIFLRIKNQKVIEVVNLDTIGPPFKTFDRLFE